MDNQDKIRIDKWLWAARFYKTRSLAADAVNGGKVHVNGLRVKSSKPVSVEDQLEITHGQIQSVVIIKALAKKRGSAKVAQALYEETQESVEKRELKSQQRKLLNAGMPNTKTKPDKHQRKQIRKVSGKAID